MKILPDKRFPLWGFVIGLTVICFSAGPCFQLSAQTVVDEAQGGRSSEQGAFAKAGLSCMQQLTAMRGDADSLSRGGRESPSKNMMDLYRRSMKLVLSDLGLKVGDLGRERLKEERTRLAKEVYALIQDGQNERAYQKWTMLMYTLYPIIFVQTKELKHAYGAGLVESELENLISAGLHESFEIAVELQRSKALADFQIMYRRAPFYKMRRVIHALARKKYREVGLSFDGGLDGRNDSVEEDQRRFDRVARPALPQPDERLIQRERQNFLKRASEEIKKIMSQPEFDCLDRELVHLFNEDGSHGWMRRAAENLRLDGSPVSLSKIRFRWKRLRNLLARKLMLVPEIRAGFED